MRIPPAPSLRPVAQISPSAYEKMLRCNARAAWSLFGDANSIPLHPKAFLGTCYHRTIEDAHAGRLRGDDAAARLARAREAFDLHARRLHQESHPLVRTKFPAPERLPYYALFRERVALHAASLPERSRQGEDGEGSRLHLQTTRVEARISSRDGLVVGRPDLVDPALRQVVDHKTGTVPPPGQPRIRDSEARQLRLYAHLAAENGMMVSEGIILRSDGEVAALAVPPEDAAAEGTAARRLLAGFNARAGADFASAAQPSPEACLHCPCIPLCEAFWKAATPTWADGCGIHVEGVIRTVEESVVQGTKLKTFGLSITRGTVAVGNNFVEQIPEAWIVADGSECPKIGEHLRVTEARVEQERGVVSIRVDRISTTVWSGIPADTQTPTVR